MKNEAFELHRVLLEAERREYERVHGRLEPSELLDAAVHHPLFAWLRPFTSLLSRIDEDDEVAIDAQLASLLTVDAQGSAFQRRYAELVQASPDVAFAHGATMRTLRARSH